MQALIVGADRVDTIRAEIFRVADRLDIDNVSHWPGRKASESRRRIPPTTGLVIFVCDRANHMMMKSVRGQAQTMGIPMLFCRHSATDVRERLDDLACNRCVLDGRSAVTSTQ